jgi:hypothetical protein
VIPHLVMNLHCLEKGELVDDETLPEAGQMKIDQIKSGSEISHPVDPELHPDDLAL